MSRGDHDCQFTDGTFTCALCSARRRSVQRTAIVGPDPVVTRHWDGADRPVQRTLRRTTMNNTCDARIRPMAAVNATEVGCEQDGEHPIHRGTLRDYAWPGSETVVEWAEADRRTFHGEWPGDCHSGCILPFGHPGGHTR